MNSNSKPQYTPFRFVIVFLLAAILYPTSTSATIYTIPGGTISLTTQTEVDAFAPNLVGIDSIIGDLEFNDDGGSPFITDISMLDDIVYIKGSLKFIWCPLDNIKLDKLKYASLIHISNYSDTDHPSGTPYSFSGELSLSQLDSTSIFTVYFTDISSINTPNLSAITSSAFISGMEKLESFNAPQLSEVGSYFILQGADSLSNLNINNLESVGGMLRLQRSDKLQTLKLNKLKSVGGDCNITSFSVLETIEMPNITSVTGDFMIGSLKKVQEMVFDNLESANSIQIYYNINLTSISINKLTNIENSIEIYKNNTLQTVTFNQLKQVNKDFVVAGLKCSKVDNNTPTERVILLSGQETTTQIDNLTIPLLDSVIGRFILSGLHQNSVLDWGELEHVGDDLEIKVAPIGNYCHLPGIVIGDILLYTTIDNQAITREYLNNGFCNFNEVYFGDLYLETQTDVNNINYSLQGREKIWGSLYLGSPDSYQADPIINLKPLQQIKVLSHRLLIGGGYDSGNGYQTHSNPSLTSLDGLENLTMLNSGIYIRYNSSLSDFCALSGLVLSGEVPESNWTISDNKYNPTFTQIGTSACLSTDVYTGDIYIRNQSEMNALLSTLNGISLIKGSLYIGSPETTPSDPIINLLPLNTIEVVNGNVYLGGDYNSGTGYISHHNPSLLSLQGLGELKQITGMFGISNNPGGLSFNGVDNLQIINDKLLIQNNQTLISLNGLETISACDTVEIQNNPNLDIFCALNHLISSNTYDLSTWLVSGNNFNPTFSQMQLGVCSSGSDASHIYFGDIVIQSQTEMDGINSVLDGVTILAGNISIGSPQGVTSDLIVEFKHLGSLRKITGSLTIGSNPSNEPGNTYSNAELISLSGFDTLNTIGVGLHISRNPLLQTISGFDSLTTINSHTNIQNNDFLYDYCNLTNVVTNMQSTPFVWQTSTNLYNPTKLDILNGDCAMDVSHIYFGDVIVRTQTELDAIATVLNTKTRIIGNVYIGSPDLNEPDSIFNLSAFENIISIDSSLFIGGIYNIGNGTVEHYNTGISSLLDFSNLEFIGNMLSISNTQLITLNGLSQLSTADEGITIENNSLLNDFCDISAFVIAKPPIVWQVSGNEYNPTTSNIVTGICNKKLALSHIGDIYVTSQSEMDALTLLLAGKKYIFGNVYLGSPDVSSIDPVVDLSPLENIIDIAYDFWIGGSYPPEGEAIAKEHYNPQLENLIGLDTLTLISGNLAVSNNNASNFTLSGIEDLTLIEGNLTIDGNEYLKSIEGLTNLEKIGRNFIVFNNSELTTLNLNSTYTIGRHVQVLNNAKLQTVSFNQLNKVSNDFRILGTDCTFTYSDGLAEYITIEAKPTLLPIIDTLNIPVLDTIVGDLYLSNFHDSSYIDWNSLEHIGNSVFIGITPDTSYCHLPTVAVGDINLYKGIAHDTITREDLEGDFCNFPDIYFGDLFLKTQDDVNKLDSILHDKDRIWGNIYIGSLDSYQTDPIIDLQPLSNIKFISKDLYIGGAYNSGTGILVHYNSSLTNLDGLENIIRIGNDLTIENNAFLINYCALSSLALSGELPESRWRISNNRYNPSFADISSTACQSNELYIGDLFIKSQSEMDALLIILAGKTMIEGSVYIGSPEVTPLDPVINLLPLDSIEVVNGDVFLGGDYNSGTGEVSHHNPSLLSLQGLSSLTQITGTFGILNNPGGLSFNGVNSLQIINDKLRIENNQTLVSLIGLETLSSCDTVVIQNNTELDQFCALNLLINSNSYDLNSWLVSGNTYNPSYNDMSLGKCSSGADLSHIYFGDIVIRNQTEMDTINTLLDGVTIIDGNVSIGSVEGNNADPILALKHLSKIKYITRSLTIGGISGSDISATYTNTELSSLNGFDSLTSIGIDLNICRNPLLQSIDDFTKLQTIISHANIANNQFLYDYCMLTEAVVNMKDTPFVWQTENNFYNPTMADILSGNCAMDVSHIYFGDIIIQTQSEADAIKSLLTTKSRIIGTVFIGATIINQTDSIVDLSAFENIVSIDSSLHIGGSYAIGSGEQEHYNTGLISLQAFSNLNYVGNTLSICNNQLETLNGLSLLTSAKNGVRIENNKLLNDFCDLTLLLNTEIPAYWQVNGNDFNPTINDIQIGNCNKILFITYVGDIYVRTQTEMDALTTLLANKEIIDGSIFVGSPETNPSDPVVDFSPLHEIYEIESDLWIGGSFAQQGETANHYHHNPQLIDLTGLDTLLRVNGDVTVVNNTLNDFSLSGLDALNTIGNNLNISNNKHLNSLSGLDKLESIGYRLYIFYNPSLVTLEGIDAINNVGDLISIDNNAPLFNFCALSSLLINGYANDWFVENNFYNPSVSDMVNGNCSGIIPEKYFLGSLWITNQTEMEIAGVMLQDSTGIVGDVYIGSTSLPAVDPVVDFSPINNIENITGGLYIGVAYTTFFTQGTYSNPSLSSFAGLSKLESVGHLYIDGNPLLTNFAGLDNMKSITGDCYVNNNSSLKTLSGLGNLDSIGSVFYVYNNPVLESLSGINNLKWIGNSVDIWNNNSLESLLGLESLNTVNRNMYIRDNSLLTNYCALNELASQSPLDDLRWFAESNSIDPMWSEIEDGTHCNLYAITPRTSGLTSSTSSDLDGGLIYLSDENLIVSLNNKSDGTFNLNMYTTLGRLVYSKDDINITDGYHSLDVGNLSSGVYIIQLTENNEMRHIVSKLLKANQ